MNDHIRYAPWIPAPRTNKMIMMIYYSQHTPRVMLPWYVIADVYKNDLKYDEHWTFSLCRWWWKWQESPDNETELLNGPTLSIWVWSMLKTLLTPMLVQMWQLRWYFGCGPITTVWQERCRRQKDFLKGFGGLGGSGDPEDLGGPGDFTN